MIPKTEAYRRIWLTNFAPEIGTKTESGNLITQSSPRPFDIDPGGEIELPLDQQGKTVILEAGLDSLWTLSFSVLDPYRIWMNTANFRNGLGMFGLGCRFEAGYRDKRYADARVQWENAYITSMTPQFGANGMVTLSAKAQGASFTLTRNSIQLVYPSAGDPEGKYEALGRSWAVLPFVGEDGTQRDFLTLYDLVKGIASCHRIRDADVDPLFQQEEFRVKGAPKEGGPITQGNASGGPISDYQFLKQLAERYEADFWYDGTALRFWARDTLATKRPEQAILYVYNTPFGDGNRKNFCAPEEVDLNNPTVLPMLDLSVQGVNLLQAPPFARGKFLLNENGEVAMQMNTAGTSHFGELEGLDGEKVREHAERFARSGDPTGLPATAEVAIWDPVRGYRFPGQASYAQISTEGLLYKRLSRQGVGGTKGKGDPNPVYFKWPFEISFLTLGHVAWPGQIVEVSNLVGWLDGFWMVYKVTQSFGGGGEWTTGLTLKYGPMPANPVFAKNLLETARKQIFGDEPLFPDVGGLPEASVEPVWMKLGRKPTLTVPKLGKLGL